MRLFTIFSFLLFSSFVFGQQQPGTYTEFWGMTSSGGTKNAGTIFKMNQTGQGYEVFKSLSDSNDYASLY